MAVKRVLITGASGSLGRAVTASFLEDGVEVIGVDRAVETQGLHPHPEGQEGHFQANLDVTQPQDITRVWSEIESSRGPVDTLVHCAGGFRWSKIEDISNEDLDFLLRVNLLSSLYLVREAVPKMKAHGFGRMILVSSRSTLGPGMGEGPYAASKAGINALVKSVAAEIASEPNLTINAVLPAILDTPPNRAEMPDADFSRWVPLPKIAQVIRGLTREDQDIINGALLPISGRL